MVEVPAPHPFSAARRAAWLDLANEAVIARNDEGTILFWNAAAARCYGWSRAEALGRSCHALLKTEFAEPFARIRASLGRNGIWEAELVQSHKSGQRLTIHSRWVVEHPHTGRPGAILEFNTNITPRKLVQRALRGSQQRLNLAAMAARFAVWECELATKRVTWSGCLDVIAAFHRSMNGPANERMLELVHPEDRQRVREEIESALNRGTFATLEFRTQSAVGVQWFTSEFGPVEETTGRQTRLFGVLRETTARKALEEQLAVARRLELIGKLAGGVAHDFNNLLTVIIGSADSANLLLEPNSPARAEVGAILRAASSASMLTRQLLGFARRQVSSPRELDVNDVVASTLPMLNTMAGDQIVLHVTSSEIPAVVRIDPTQLEQVLVNLVSNARQAMPGGGDIFIRVECIEIGAHGERYPGVPPGAHVVLSVRDTGGGMTAQVQQHLFEPFFTTKDVGEGTGLGLASCYGIVQQAGGYIWGGPHPELGSVFEVVLPSIVAPSATSERRAPSGSPSLGGDEAILLVDDDEQVLRVLAAQLVRLGYRVCVAKGGTEAIDKFGDGHFDLVISDLIMPGMNGRQLVQRLREAGHVFEVLFVSGFSRDVISDHSILEGPVNYLQKPFSSKVLACRVRELLDAARRSRTVAG